MVKGTIGLLAAIPAALVHALNFLVAPPGTLVLLRTRNGNERVNGGERVTALKTRQSRISIDARIARKRVKRVDLPEGDEGCDAQPSQAGRLQRSQVSDRTALLAGIVPVATLVLRTWDAPHSVVASLAAAAGTESSFEAEGRMG